MRRVVVLAAVAVGLGTADARACSLAAPPDGRTLAEVRFEEARRVVIGRVTSRRETPPGPDGMTSSSDPVDLGFKVARSLKGRGRQWLRLRSSRDSASCGAELRVGQWVGLSLDAPVDGRHLVGIASVHSPDELRRIARRT